MNRIPKAVYTKEFREEAVKLALTEGVGVSEAARRLSIPMKSLANWVRAAKAGKLGTVGQGQKPLTDLEMELNRVKRELAEVKMERDLEKVPVYLVAVACLSTAEAICSSRLARSLGSLLFRSGRVVHIIEDEAKRPVWPFSAENPRQSIVKKRQNKALEQIL